MKFKTRLSSFYNYIILTTEGVDQAKLDVWHCKLFWCLGLDSSFDCERQNNATTPVRRISAVGWSCPKISTSNLFSVEDSATPCNGKLIPCCYHPKNVNIAFKQVHGFSGTSVQAYSGVVYISTVDTNGQIHTSLVIAKTKFSQVKKLTISWPEFFRAQLLLNYYIIAKWFWAFILNISLTEQRAQLSWISC